MQGMKDIASMPFHFRLYESGEGNSKFKKASVLILSPVAKFYSTKFIWGSFGEHPR